MAVLEGNIIPYTQDEIETVVRAIYKNNGVSDVDYEGSNVSQLASVMSYCISVLNTNTAANLPEVILPLSTKVKTAQYGARHIGYETHRKISYQYNLDVYSVFNPDTIGDTIEFNIPRNSALKSGANNYYYLGEDIVGTYVSPASEAAVSVVASITVKEGNFKFFADESVLTYIANEEYNNIDQLVVKQDYLVPYSNVEQEGLQVFLSYTDPSKGTITRELWSQNDVYLVDSTFDQLQNSYVVVNNIYLSQPIIKFKIGNYGQGVLRGSIIEVNALISKGSAGLSSGDFSFVDEGVSATLAVDNIRLAVRGQDQEHIDDIKTNAPIFTNTANRAVTRLDYVALAQKHYAVNRAECWGGEEVILDASNFMIRAFEVTDQTKVSVGVSPLDLNSIITDGWVEVSFAGDVSPWDNTATYSDGNIVYLAVSDDDLTALGAVWLSVTPELTELSYTSNDSLLNTLYTADRLTDLSNWYLTEGHASGGEIYKPAVPSATDRSLMKYLDPYKIMTLELNHRQPAYLDFEYSINVIKYNAVKAARVTNQEIFDILKAYFDSDIRDFDTEHIMSNVIRRIDDLLTDISGLEIDLKTSLSFTDSNDYLFDPLTPDRYIGLHANPDSINISAIRMYLAEPFTSMYNSSNELEKGLIPNVETLSYGPGGDLIMDISAAIPYADTINIALRRSSDSAQIGEYIVRNELGIIEVVLWDVTNNCNMVNNIGKIDVVYPDKLNFPVTRNVMPRLRTVAFV